MTMPGVELQLRLEYENHFRQSGFTTIAGIDEVGRGALAGPLVAAAVVLPPPAEILADLPFWSRVRDSKTISSKQRALLAAGIAERCPVIHRTAIPPDMLDAIGVAAANRLAMELAVQGLPTPPDLLLIDAMTLDTGLPQIGIIDGDAKSLSVAAASIIAKVWRDTTMCELDTAYPDFGFARHKGYGVSTHLQALREWGPCPEHRFSYAPVRESGLLHGIIR